MPSITDLHIAGIDETRPPAIRKEPYIDLYFKLSQQAPEAWCGEFNDLAVRMEASPKIDAGKGLFINSWVRTPEEIPAHLEILKTKVAEATTRYLAKIALAKQAEKDAGADSSQTEGPQGKLNKIIAGLDFTPARTG